MLHTVEQSGAKIKVTSQGSLEAVLVSENFKRLKEKNCLPRILFLAKIHFRNKGEIKMFADIQTPKESIRPAPQEILEEVLQAEGE